MMKVLKWEILGGLLGGGMGKGKVVYKNSVEEKIKVAHNIIDWALNKEGPHAVFFSASHPSTVMLYLIREAKKNGEMILVFHVELLKNEVRLYQYLRKIEILWNLGIRRERNEFLISQEEITGDWEKYYYHNTLSVRNKMILKYGIKFLFVADYGPYRTDTIRKITIARNYPLYEIKPLLSFNKEEIMEVIKIQNLPVSPLFGVASKEDYDLSISKKLIGKYEENTDNEEKEVASKLRSLGYF